MEDYDYGVMFLELRHVEANNTAFFQSIEVLVVRSNLWLPRFHGNTSERFRYGWSYLFSFIAQLRRSWDYSVQPKWRKRFSAHKLYQKTCENLFCSCESKKYCCFLSLDFLWREKMKILSRWQVSILCIARAKPIKSFPTCRALKTCRLLYETINQ